MTKDELDQAIRDFHKADSIEKQAKDLREHARLNILIAREEGLCKAGTVQTSDGTMKVTITVPMKKGLPARFDDSRVEDFYRFVEDTMPALTEQAFQTQHTLDFEKLCDLIKVAPETDTRLTLIDTLGSYMLPATDDEAMSPRVAAK